MKIWKFGRRASKPVVDSPMQSTSKTDVELGTGHITLIAGDWRCSIDQKELERIIQHYYADRRYAHQVSKEEFREMVAIKDMTYADLRAEVIRRRLADNPRPLGPVENIGSIKP